jgi:uncharacterized protein
MDEMAAPLTPESRSEPGFWWRSIYLTTPLVIFIAIAPYTCLRFHFRPALSMFGVHNNLLQINALASQTFQVALLVMIILVLERRPLASLGVRQPKLSDLVWGILGFAIIHIGSTVWSFAVLPYGGAHSQLAEWASQWAAQSPVWRFTLVVCASFFEEFYFRGYLIERVEEITGSMAAGSFVGTAVDLYIHSTYWNARYVASIAFDQFSLALLYLWHRSVATCIIAHFLLDAPFI